MRFIILHILCSISFLSSSQGFKVRHYLSNSLNSDARAIFETTPGNYIGCGYSIETLNNLDVTHIVITGLDSQGQIVWSKKYAGGNFEYLNNGFIRRCFYKQENSIYLACCVRDNNNRQIGALLKFDFNGDTIWQKIYTDPDPFEDVIPQMVTGTVDGGFLITGFFQSWSANYSKCLVIKTDANGNELWRKKIAKQSPNVQDGKVIIQDSASKKIVIAGYQYIGGINIYDNILILDSLGNNAQQIAYINGGGNVLDMIQTKDKKMVVVGYKYYPQTIGGSHLMRSYVMKFDLNNPLVPIWKIDNFDSLVLGNAFGCIKELNNGNILISGIIDTMQLHNEPTNTLHRLTILDNDGNLVWNRYYDYKTNASLDDYNIAPSSLELASDGGWIAAIQVINASPNPLFFVKYDASGCDSTAAHCATLNLVSIKEVTENDPEIRIYPNPVNDFLIIKMNLYPELTELSITDTFGHEIKRMQIDSKVKVDVSDLSKGIYLVIISKNKEIVYKTKLIKE